MPAKLLYFCGMALASPIISEAAAVRRSGAFAANQIHCADVLDFLGGIAGSGVFDIVIADPPYNIGKDFGNNRDNLDLPEYLAWSDKWLGECLRLAKPGAPVYVYGFAEVLAHIAVRYPIKQQRWLVWHYTNKTVPSLKFWQRSHESILCLWRGDRPVIDVDAVREEYTPTFLNGAAGKVRKDTYCRYSTKGKKTIYNAHPKGAMPRDVFKTPALAGGAGYVERWFYCKTCARLCTPKESEEHREHEVIKHPTQKPAALAEKLIASIPAARPNVLVPFAGSGSECVVAQKMGAVFSAAEINPDYVLLATRWLANERGSNVRD